MPRKKRSKKPSKPTVSEEHAGRTVRALWPTPMQSDGKKGTRNQRFGTGSPTLASAAAMDPMPRACAGLRSSGMNRTELYRAMEAADAPPEQTGQPTLFPADSLASLYLSPGGDEARKMTAGSGQRCLESYGRSGPLGSLLRMLLGSSTWGSPSVYLTWKVRAMKSRRYRFQLVPSEPRTDEIVSSLWLTPSTEDHKSDGPKTMQHYLDAEDGGPRPPSSAQRLRNQVAMYPTPVQDDTGHRSAKYQQGGSALSTVTGGQLNPTWVEWLMGFPIGWTDCEPSETP